MILLLSSDGDYSTERIVQWLRYYQYTDYLRLSPLDFIECPIDINPREGLFNVRGKEFDFGSIKVVWYRRFGGYTFSGHFNDVKEKISEKTAELLKNELNNITDFFISLIPAVPIIGSTRKNNTNKLIELYKAQQAGLNVPFTMVTSKKASIERMTKEHANLISKSAFNARPISYEDKVYTMFTAQLTEQDMVVIPDSFFPSLIQEEVKKDYEIRVFYYLGKLYNMAIISQNNPQTRIDFRRYDTHTPNRFIPCEIDKETKEKIVTFMNSMDLNIGSLDFVKGIDGKLYFLEVNYMGQFGMVDIPCNYGIHKYITNHLISLDSK